MRKYQRNRFWPTNSKRWRSIRAQVLAEQPHCEECLRNGKRTVGNQVDHIDGQASKAEDYRRSNLQTLCEPCHSSKTMREQNRERGYRLTVGCDADGFPRQGAG
jgi:5-methylcytosine-specific restriction endonuclease McrA